MTNHYEDEAQIEEVRRWVKENWIPLALGLALGLGVILGWQTLGAHRDAQRQDAARILNDLNHAVAANKIDDAQAMAKRLVEDYTSTPYAAQAQLLLASVADLAGRYDEAQSRLQWVVDYEQHGTLFGRIERWTHARALSDGRDPALLPIAELRLARIYWQMGKNSEALKQIDAINAPEFAALSNELRGDVMLASGDRAGARAAYEAALKSAADNPQLSDGLHEKIDTLADVVAAKS